MLQKKNNFNHTVTSSFEIQTEKNPDFIAVRDNIVSYSYSDFNQRANQFARWLIEKNVKKSDFVSILLEPSVDFITCMLAIIKVGAIYVPLDTASPAARLETIIDDLKPKLVITDKKYESRLTKGTNIGLIEDMQLACAQYHGHNLNTDIDSCSPIYLMYTSGSSGKPKGVLVPHNAVVNLTKIDNYANIEKETKIGQFSNLAFDGCTFEIWSALLNGATLEIIPVSIRTNNVELKQYLQEQQVTCLFLPTGYFHQLAKSFPETLNPIKMIIFGGEQANPGVIKNFLNYRKTNRLPISLINGYGPTEATTFTCRHVITEDSCFSDEELMSIGNAIENVKTYIIDEHGNQASEGELYISGINLALGYYITDKNTNPFSINPFDKQEPYGRIYKTGDRVKLLPSGKLLCLGRFDDQCKIGGFRVHLNEVENELMKHKEIDLAAVVVEIGGGSHKILTAYLVLSSQNVAISANDIRDFLSLNLPVYMIPSKYIIVDELPLTLVGKVDKKNLDKLPHTILNFHADKSPESPIEESIKKIWEYLLNQPNIDVHKNLFELGANSLLMLEACARINKELKIDLQITQTITHPTIHRLSRFIEGDIDIPVKQERRAISSSDIAIIGMSCRFPKANSVQEFWENICQGKVCLENFNEKQLAQLSSKLKDENFVPVRGILADIEKFDAHFFGFSPIDASITDPQQRLFIECAWEALEHAAVVPSQTGNKIGVYAGMADSTYLQENLLKSNWAQQELDRFQQRIASSAGMMATQVSYRLNLKGKSINVNTACSTGLVSVAEACQSLIMGTSDIILAGSSSIVVPQVDGYIYKQGGIESADGYCRPFEERASGTVFSNGVGVVVLKRLEDAIADNNTIFAVIKGVGINNDGSDKLGYTAPSTNGQISCIRDALLHANIQADKLSYIEAHGTATSLGDAVEIEALSTVFREQTDKKQYCALGSVKGNIGHTDVSSGIAGLIKTTLCLFNKKIPPMPQFATYNSHINFEESPFFINSQLLEWQKEDSTQLYAGVSSFGVGGTNVHLVLSEHIPTTVTERTSGESLVVLSAKTKSALKQNIENLIKFLNNSESVNDFDIADVAYTLQKGRETFQWRCFAVGNTREEIINNLLFENLRYRDIDLQPNAVFMFPGQGTQYHQMASELMIKVPFFASLVKYGVSTAKAYLDIDLLEIINYPHDERLNQTQYAQPALFILEYALAKLLIHYGVKPNSVIGHNLGEYVAACIAGVFSFEDAIALVCQRGLLMASAPSGAMLAIECTQAELSTYLENVELALHNSIDYFVVSGETTEINRLEKILVMSNKPFRRLPVSHAFHSQSMDAIEQKFKNLFANLTLSAPNIPMISNVTGTWISTKEATDPQYWYTHLRQTVQFCKGIETLLENNCPLFIEVGPGQSLNVFLKKIANYHKKKLVSTHTLPAKHDEKQEYKHFLTAIGIFWQHGIAINWQSLYENTVRKHIPLPTYAFQKQRYWIEPDPKNTNQVNSVPKIYIPTWHRWEAYKKSILSPSLIDSTQHSWIIFTDGFELGKQIITLLEEKSVKPIIVTKGEKFSQENPHSFKINSDHKNGYLELFQAIKAQMQDPIILHLSSYTEIDKDILSSQEIDEQLTQSFYSLLYLTQAYIGVIGNRTTLKIGIITAGTQQILGTEKINPINATLVGASRVIMQEHPEIQCKLFDLNPREVAQNNHFLFNKIIASCLYDKWNEDSLLVIYRNGYQWRAMYSVAEEKSLSEKKIDRLKDNGVYMLTGGLGGMALSFCKAITKKISNPSFIILSRRELPDESEWEVISKNSEHRFYRIINQINKLRELGALFFFYQVDISQYEQLESVIQQCINRFRKINGLIHTAGVSNPALLEFKSRVEVNETLLPKIYGTFNLAKSLNNCSLDFAIFTSSLSALVGGYQQIDYSSANACLDAFVDSGIFASCSFVTSINWNTWRDVGIAAEAASKGEATFIGKGDDISPQQGQELFLRILQEGENRVAISNNEIKLGTVDPVPNVTDISPQIKIARNDIKEIADYIVPSNKTELKLAKLWQEALGIEYIGIMDNYFSLGGNSLNAINLIKKINKNFNCNLPATQIYRDPTIKQLSSTLLGVSKNHPLESPLLLKEVDKNPPYLFLFHPVSGLINCFNSFVSQSELPLSIYGIQDPSIDANEMLYDGLLSMVDDYLLKIQKIQPVGPYFLIGYSFGGSVLFEVANKLLQQGQKISLLVLIDSWTVNPSVFKKKDYFQEYLKEQGLSEEIINLALDREKFLTEHSLSNLCQEMLLFKAAKLSDLYQDIRHPTNGWSNYNRGKIICHSIDGNHETILNDRNSKIMLQHISQYLTEKNYRITNDTFEKYTK